MARKVTWAYRERVARVRRQLERDPSLAVCWLCGAPINMQLPYHHMMAFTLDHVIPLSRGGNLMGETRPAHRRCNSERNGDTPEEDTILEW